MPRFLIAIIMMTFRKPASGSGHYSKGLRQYCLKRECLLNGKSNFRRRDGVMLHLSEEEAITLAVPLFHTLWFLSIGGKRQSEQVYFHLSSSREKAGLVLEDSKQLSQIL